MTDHHHTEYSDTTLNPIHQGEDTPPSSPETALDLASYQAYLMDMGMSDTQAQEFIQTLWHIVATFVDMGWGIEATQSALRQIAQDDINKTLQNQ